MEPSYGTDCPSQVSMSQFSQLIPLSSPLFAFLCNNFEFADYSRVSRNSNSMDSDFFRLHLMNDQTRALVPYIRPISYMYHQIQKQLRVGPVNMNQHLFVPESATDANIYCKLIRQVQKPCKTTMEMGLFLQQIDPVFGDLQLNGCLEDQCYWTAFAWKAHDHDSFLLFELQCDPSERCLSCCPWSTFLVQCKVYQCSFQPLKILVS